MLHLCKYTPGCTGGTCGIYGTWATLGCSVLLRAALGVQLCKYTPPIENLYKTYRKALLLHANTKFFFFIEVVGFDLGSNVCCLRVFNDEGALNPKGL